VTRERTSAVEARNRELAEALDRVVFLERVKRSLDRFVPETVQRAIEENPRNPRARRDSARRVVSQFETQWPQAWGGPRSTILVSARARTLHTPAPRP
jgi:hypothetical protein